jgi:hypothetical protein
VRPLRLRAHRVALGVAIIVAFATGLVCLTAMSRSEVGAATTDADWSALVADHVGESADPHLLVEGEVVYAYTTNARSMNVPVVVVQPDGSARTFADVLPRVATWSTPGYVWAPAVMRTSSGYALYYSTRERVSGQQCISVAFATSPTGPFSDLSSGPLVCQRELGGSIDPSLITVDGVATLLWKNDGNCCEIATSLWSAQLNERGTALVTEPAVLLTAADGWEGGVIEAPSMIDVGDRFLLLYSGNRWDSADYAIGTASCATVAGPCERTAAEPWLRGDERTVGPGGAEVTRTTDGTVLMAYHSWSQSTNVRSFSIRVVDVSDARPTVVPQ